MIAAGKPRQHAPDAKLLVVAADCRLTHVRRAQLPEFLHRGDLVVANDAATLPASLHGVHRRTGAAIELRLVARRTLAATDLRHCTALVFGAGDFHTRTEHRPPPPPLAAGDRLTLGPLVATIERRLHHPRLVELRFDGSPAEVWEGVARHGRPIQYAHVPLPLALWDVWTPFAATPVAFEPPSAGFALDWSMLAALRERGVGFVTLTHAAGISSTGDAALDALLPFAEPYFIPASTARALRRTRARGGRIVAVGTTVVRALEHAAALDGTVRAGTAVADQRIGAGTRLRVVDVILSGTHERGSSHYELLRAFADNVALQKASAALDAHGYRTHEFGDSILLERARTRRAMWCERVACAA
jgi:S-adenosylmethionine:tRNA ribosyltransferase-isomerase